MIVPQDQGLMETLKSQFDFDDLYMGWYKVMAIPTVFLENCLDKLRSDLSEDVLNRISSRIAFEAGIGTAESMKPYCDSSNHHEWLNAVGWVVSNMGFAKEEITQVKANDASDSIQYSGIWRDSVQADYWLRRNGQSKKPVCIFMEYFASGVASRVFNQRIIVRETQCVAQGYDHCTFEGRTVNGWGDIHGADEMLTQSFSVSDYMETVKKNHQRLQAELKKRTTKRINRTKKEKSRGTYEEFVSKNEKITKFLVMAKKVAPTDTTILIQGESGTGKEVMARYIHRFSGRQDEPFIAINCAALPFNLLESELFGHVKGAFTGADRTKDGLLTKAEKGTIFLDEIGTLPLTLQPKLLRVIQQKAVRPVGGIDLIPVDARIIVATNSDLRAMMADGAFREDLYYRLAVFPINLCPLKERQEDIALLARYFISKTEPKHPGISQKALHILNSYSWPGNIRELENCIEFAMILADNTQITLEHLPGYLFQNTESSLETLSQNFPTQKEMEKQYTRLVLIHTNQNKKEAARVLGISVPTLWRRLKTYGA